VEFPQPGQVFKPAHGHCESSAISAGHGQIATENGTDEDVSFLIPYLTSNVKRFGEFNLELNRPPEPWIKDSVFQQAASGHTSPARNRENDMINIPLASFRLTPYGEVGRRGIGKPA